MNLATIAVRNAGRNAFRTTLTIIAVAVAVAAFLLLRTVLSAWLVGAEYSAKDRLATRHKVSFVMTLPKSYVDSVKNVPGVQGVTWFTWFGGKVPGKEDQFFGSLAVDPPSFLQVYDEVQIPDAQRKAWLEDRGGALVGSALAAQFGWKVGDHVRLQGSVYAGEWDFTIDAIYTATRKSLDQSSLFFHWDYLNENENLTPLQRDQVGWIASKLPHASEGAAVARRIDQVFDARDIQTLSMSERAMQTSFVSMISSLLDALQVLSFCILVIMTMVLGNTIAMAVRERTREYGVLRAIGFVQSHVVAFVIIESTVIGLAGGLLGAALSYPLIDRGIGRFMEENLTGFFPYFRLASSDVLIAVGCSVLLSAVAASIPAIGSSKLSPNDALRNLG